MLTWVATLGLGVFITGMTGVQTVAEFDTPRWSLQKPLGAASGNALILAGNVLCHSLVEQGLEGGCLAKTH